MWFIAQDGTAYNREIFASIEIEVVTKEGEPGEYALVATLSNKASTTAIVEPADPATTKVQLASYHSPNKVESALRDIVAAGMPLIDLRDIR